jgi:nucleotide-binding universal stress UspA family protein
MGTIERTSCDQQWRCDEKSVVLFILSLTGINAFSTNFERLYAMEEAIMIKHILVATDGSDKARQAVEIAATIAKSLDARITILHVILHGVRAKEATRLARADPLLRRRSIVQERTVVSANDLFQSVQGDLGEAASVLGAVIAENAAEDARSIGAGDVHTRVEPGDYAETILAVAEEIGADMIVVGSRGLGRLAGMVLGSVSQKIVEHAGCSVTVVR